MISVTRRQVLSEMLLYYENRARIVSKNLANIEPMEGYELQFQADKLRCVTIRKMMQELEGGKKLEDAEEREPADWQREIMRHPEKALVLDITRRNGYGTEDPVRQEQGNRIPEE